MTIRSSFWTRVWNFAGLVCLAVSLFLLPAGVRSVHAADGGERLMSADPSQVPSESAILDTAPAAPVAGACEVDALVRPRPIANEAPSRIIVLSTRGYNYDSAPSRLDPAALRLESKTR